MKVGDGVGAGALGEGDGEGLREGDPSGLVGDGSASVGDGSVAAWVGGDDGPEVAVGDGLSPPETVGL